MYSQPVRYGIRACDDPLEIRPRRPDAVRQQAAYWGKLRAHRFTDEQLGCILDALGEIGQADNSVAAFTVGNGL